MFLVLTLLASLAWLGITSVHNASDRARLAEVSLRHIEGMAHELNALEEQATAEKQFTTPGQERAQEIDLQMRRELEGLRTLLPQAEQRPLADAYTRYRLAEADQLRLIRGGDHRGAEAVAVTRVDPAFAALLGLAADALRRNAAAAARANLIADAGTGAILLAAALAIWALFRRFAREQRASASAEVRLAAQEGLRRGHQRFAALAANASDVIAILSSEGEIQYVTPNAQRLWGYAPDALLRADAASLACPEDAGHLQTLLNQAARVQAGESLTTEVRLRNASGTDCLSEVVLTNLLSEPAVAGIVMTCRDVTERKALEAERERMLVEALEQADRDPLTGLLNHRAFHRRLAEEADRAWREGEPLAVAVLDLDNFKFFNDVYGHVLGDQVLRQVAGALLGACRSYDTAARFGGDEFALLLPGAGGVTAAEIEARLRAALAGLCFRPDGQATAIPITVSVGAALLSPLGAALSNGADNLNTGADNLNTGADNLNTGLVDGLNTDAHAALEAADARLLRAKTGGGADAAADRVREAARGAAAGFSMLDALVTAVDNKDRYTRRHSEDVMEYSLMIARGLGLDEAALHTVGVAALLHDVGKIGVPDHILRKPGGLTEAEFEAVKQHPQMGAIIVQAVPGLDATVDAVRLHHERWDGGGYPFGLFGEETPLIARLMAVADGFSAMTTDRPYRRGMDRERALTILRDGAGTQWDPVCVRAFLRATGAVHGPVGQSACL